MRPRSIGTTRCHGTLVIPIAADYVLRLIRRVSNYLVDNNGQVREI
jgi:hypothetical protein